MRAPPEQDYSYEGHSQNAIVKNPQMNEDIVGVREDHNRSAQPYSQPSALQEAHHPSLPGHPNKSQ